MRIRTFTAGPFGENAYLALSGAGEALAIDPGAGAAAMVAALREAEADLLAIVLTHAHLDHVEGVAALHAHAPAPIYLHPADRPLYDSMAPQAEAFGVEVDTPPPPDEELHHGDVLDFGFCTFDVRHAPGHAPGHVILWAQNQGLAFVGDVIFQGSIGRSDLWQGDFRELMRSIRQQVLTLPDQTRLLPGHGSDTTVGHERRTNPFLIPIYGGELV